MSDNQSVCLNSSIYKRKNILSQQQTSYMSHPLYIVNSKKNDSADLLERLVSKLSEQEPFEETNNQKIYIEYNTSDLIVSSDDINFEKSDLKGKQDQSTFDEINSSDQHSSIINSYNCVQHRPTMNSMYSGVETGGSSRSFSHLNRYFDVVYNPYRNYYESLEGVAFIRKPHNNAKFLCLECGKFLHNWESVCYHINLHRRRRPYQCPLCIKNYANRSGLKRHVIVKHDFYKNIYNCATCRKDFFSTQEFERHIQSEMVRNVNSSTKQLSLEQGQYDIIRCTTGDELSVALEQIIGNSNV